MKWLGIILIVLLSVGQPTAGQVRPEKPKPARNYAAEINQPALALPESQRAWLVYLDVMTNIAEDAPKLWHYHGYQPQRVIHNPEVVAFFKRHEPQRRRVIEASKLPHLGHILSDERTAADIRFSARRMTDEQRALYVAPEPQPPSDNPDLMAVLLQPCGESTELFDFLVGHAIWSASAGEAAAALEDIETIFRIAAQLREMPFVVADLFSLRRFSDGLHAWGMILERNPDTFSAEQLVRLETAAKSFAQGQPLVRFSHESVFADLLQRNFPAEGAIVRGAPRLSEPASLLNLVFPVGKQIVLTRKKNLAAYENLIELAERELKRPFWESNHEEFDRESARIKADETLAFAALMVFSLQNAQLRQESAIQLRDAVLTASALTRFRLATGRYPRTLGELTPNYLPTIPPDRYTGQPMRYKVDAGKPMLYSVGNDGADAGGVAAKIADPNAFGEAYPWYVSLLPKDEPVEGDMILFPTTAKLDPIDRVED